jgi:hypothetical protein
MKNCLRTLWSLVCLPTPFDPVCTDQSAGMYKAEAYNPQTQQFGTTSNLQVQVTVDETFDNDHRVVTQTTTSSDKMSKFTFSAADSGLHRLCFTPSGSAAVSVNGWFGSGGDIGGGVKLDLDLAIGETSKIESEDKGKVDSLAGKVRELNARLGDIRREQVFQRVGHILTPLSCLMFQILMCMIAGTRSRIPRPVRSNQCQNRALDAHPTRRPGRHVRMAAQSLAEFLHQAEVDVDEVTTDMYKQ